LNNADYKVVLVLSGGNALGAYHGGIYQALLEHDVAIDWLAGASTGAVNGAIICGNPPELGLQRLREYWRPAGGGVAEASGGAFIEDARRTVAAQMTISLGQSHVFVPRRLFGPWWEPFGNGEPSSLYDTSPLEGTLGRLVDFDRLNGGGIRFSATAVDLAEGRDVVFDTRSAGVRAEHLRASCALLPAFPPVEVDGVLLADGGVSANLPLDVVLSEPPRGTTLCIAIDLLPLRAPVPKTLGNTAERGQDLMMATQSRRAIEGWQRYYDLAVRASGPDESIPAITLVHLAYGAQEPEVCGKAFDFSPASVGYRWDQGYADMSNVLELLERGEISPGKPGLAVHSFHGRERV
jgi:NTE family protein